MAATVIVFVGSAHPNDRRLKPSTIIELTEGPLIPGSELAIAIGHIKEYSMQYEVCEPTLTNIKSSW